MSVSLQYAGELEYDNTKGVLLKATFTGTYGANGTGDLLNLAPYELTTNPGGVTDAGLAYNRIISSPDLQIGVFNENIGGSYVNVNPNAAPSLTNFGLRMFEPGGTEKATNAAYTAAELAGSVTLLALIGSLGS